MPGNTPPPLPRGEGEFASAPLDDLFTGLGSSPMGLSADAAADALARVGPNRIDSARRAGLARDVLRRFGNPLVLVLLFAAAVSAFTGDAASFGIIAVIVLISVALDVLQERQAQNAAERLRAQVSLTARVLRGGREAELPASEIVPGDIVVLAAGDLVPADARLIALRDLYVDEALLTGEAFPAEKQLDPPAADGAAFARNMVFMGTSVVSGTANALVVATGRRAQLGAIASALRKPPPPTAFALGIRDFGLMIVRATVLLVLFVVLVNLLFHRPLLESFLFAVALAVGLTPELLPMIVSVTLAHGAIRMAGKQVIVKRQSAIDDLGAMDVLCSDKTGTLTEARIRLIREVALDGEDSPGVLRLARINAAYETGLKSPLDEAILAEGPPDLSGWRKIDEVPFDFQRRRVSVLAEGEGRRLLIVKGAPEDVLALASAYDRADGTQAPLDAVARAVAQETFDALGREGFRALGVAWRQATPDRVHADVSDETDLVFAGFLAFLDPPKQGAREALAELAALGVRVKVVTGDNELVTRHVCAELGLDVSGTLTGPELAMLSDEALLARLDATTLFCRVTPPQKSRIIAALRRKGHVVGYLGDGINDAPSLHAADVGFSVDTAVDVAKEAAAMILLRKDLGVLADGVREGRRTFANILKYVMMGTSSNFGNMFSMAGGVLFLPFLPMLPTQILLNNLLYDLSETAIPLDRVSDATAARPRRWDTGFIRTFMYVFGPVSSVFDMATFALLLWGFRASEALFHTGWFVESLMTQILVIFVIRTDDLAGDRPHPALVATSLGALALAVALPYSPLASLLGFVPLPAALLAALAGLTAVYLGFVYAVKRWFMRRHAMG
ncbi:MAG: magnesium-translocating P-type ATPase [Proteobacteria bacterium]|nr:magnesium-translocating P-type ATPase [Pseudomonadota bacterium]